MFRGYVFNVNKVYVVHIFCQVDLLPVTAGSCTFLKVHNQFEAHATAKIYPVYPATNFQKAALVPHTGEGQSVNLGHMTRG